MDQTRKRVRLHVIGIVQGVYYRATARERAEKLGLTGWVRNVDDGSVLLEAQGPVDRIEALIVWCWEGPSGARVEDVEVSWISVQEGDQGFRVRY